MEFSKSETKSNLIKAFAGESQARNRYTFAADYAKKQQLYVVEAVFTFTAEQERAHAKVFYDLLKSESGENIEADGTYPIDNFDNIEKLLTAARHNEYEEFDVVYKEFADIAKNEGFLEAEGAFRAIAAVEKVHADRFEMLADMLKQNKLFVSDVKTKWMCLNCGHVFEGTQVPESCPVCHKPKGYFIRYELAPFSK